MALGQNTQERKTYLSISNGKVVQGKGEDKQLFSFVEGTLEEIYTRQTSFGGEYVVRWYIDLRDGADLYSLCFPFSSGVFKSIVLSLAASETLTASTTIKIEPYEGRNGFTRVAVFADGAKLGWVTKELPPLQIVTIGGKQIKDDTKRMEFISSLVGRIQNKVRK